VEFSLAGSEPVLALSLLGGRDFPRLSTPSAQRGRSVQRGAGCLDVKLIDPPRRRVSRERLAATTYPTNSGIEAVSPFCTYGRWLLLAVLTARGRQQSVGQNEGPYTSYVAIGGRGHSLPLGIYQGDACI